MTHPAITVQQVLEALEIALNGLEWFWDRYPEAVNGCDDEAKEQIETAAAGVRARIEGGGEGVPVAWQWRRKGQPWSLEKTFNSQVFATTPDSEVRPLYASPPSTPEPAGRVEAQDDEVVELIKQRDHREEIIDQLCDAVLGPDRTEWSSAYYFEDAVHEVNERLAWVEQRLENRESAAPTAPQVVELSDGDIDRLQEEYDCFGDCDAPRIHDFARAIERAVLAKAAIRQADDKARAAIAALRARIEGGGDGVPACTRWNFDATDTDVLACKDLHDKGDKCDYEVLHPADVLKCLNELRARVLATSPPSTPEPAGRVEAQGEWPADLSSTQRTKPQRFAYIWRDDGEPVIDDDDFKFDALITVHGDFDEGEKERYVAEVVRRLNGAAPTAPQAVELSEDEWIGKCIADELGSVDSIYEYARLHKFGRAVLAKAGIPASPKAAPPPPPLEPK